MLNFDLQLAVLESLTSTYIDDRRIEISSKQFAIESDVFLLNMIYLKKEKLVDISSLNSRTVSTPEIKSDEPETVKPVITESFSIARCNLTHLGMKALSANNKVKLIQA